MDNLREINRRINSTKRFEEVIRANVGSMQAVTVEDSHIWEELDRIKILCAAIRNSAWKIHELCDYIEGAINARGKELTERAIESVRGDVSPYPEENTENKTGKAE